MKLPYHRLFVLAPLLLTQCSKCKDDPQPAKPEDQLPPATQTGAGTFGCLVNGQPWTPSGNVGTPNFRVEYDPGFYGGTLTVRAYRYPVGARNPQSIIIGGAPIRAAGTFQLDSYANGTPGYSPYFLDYNVSSPCNEYSTSRLLKTSGSLIVSRLDVSAGIISGTFSFTLAQPGCDTIKVTHGRFDKKL